MESPRTARTRGGGRFQEQKVQNQRLRRATVGWSGRYKIGGVLCATRARRNGHVNTRKCRTESCGKQRSQQSTVHSTYRARWSASKESAGLKAATRFHRSEWEVRKQRSTVHGTHRRGWSTSGVEGAEPKDATRSHCKVCNLSFVYILLQTCSHNPFCMLGEVLT